jgi:hypothetical protein
MIIAFRFEIYLLQTGLGGSNPPSYLQLRKASALLTAHLGTYGDAFIKRSKLNQIAAL